MVTSQYYTMHCKSFKMENFAICKIELICWRTFAVRYQSCIAKVYCTGYFSGKGLQLPIDLQKPRNFHRERFAIYTM